MSCQWREELVLKSFSLTVWGDLVSLLNGIKRIIIAFCCLSLCVFNKSPYSSSVSCPFVRDICQCEGWKGWPNTHSHTHTHTHTHTHSYSLPHMHIHVWSLWIYYEYMNKTNQSNHITNWSITSQVLSKSTSHTHTHLHRQVCVCVCVCVCLIHSYIFILKQGLRHLYRRSRLQG